MSEGIKKVDDHLYGVTMSESYAIQSLTNVPKEYRFKMMAHELMPAVIENMEVTSWRDPEDPYVIRHTARVFMANPSQIFECHAVGRSEEVIVLDYKGFTKRVVVPKSTFNFECQEVEPLTLENMKSPFPMVGFKRLLFCDLGRRNAVGERIFEYQWQNDENKVNRRR